MPETTVCGCEFCTEARSHNIHIECWERTVCALCGEPWLCEGAVEQMVADDPDVDCQFCRDTRVLTLPQGRSQAVTVPCPECGEEEDPFGDGPYGDF